jgi:hypothetical protein
MILQHQLSFFLSFPLSGKVFVKSIMVRKDGGPMHLEKVRKMGEFLSASSLPPTSNLHS